MVNRFERLEGGGAARLIQLIRRYGYNKDVDIELATVTSPPPDLRIQIDNMKVEIDSDDLIVAQYLTKHKRQVKINGGETVELEYQDELKVGDRILVASVKNDQLYIVLDKAVMY
ncbi:hypothetical protein CV632_01235 [Geobacillus thermodenitrificans]|uniref:DUF2577 domain-containing protein n=1 Tax=Geobacillus thermodenitrificans TaxID=33940 RepID=UPI000C28ACA7|nr:DUF2577 domain-containing protein [Geobacillus thermodenitrificans]PJW21976.1 hypothetical protein CV632_01235 [Geobacillus thermodenitrificans]